MIVVERLVGYTRTRKWICSYTTKDPSYLEAKTKKYTDPDHFDAVCAFECLALKVFRQHGESSAEFEEMSTMEGFHRSRVSKEFFAQEKQSLGLITVFQIKNHGESRLLLVLQK